jgi:hypothetical protein
MEDKARIDLEGSGVSNKLTIRENVLYTIAILGAMGLIGVALWAVSWWASSR